MNNFSHSDIYNEIIDHLITKILIKYKITTKYYHFTIYVSVGVWSHFYS